MTQASDHAASEVLCYERDSPGHLLLARYLELVLWEGLVRWALTYDL